MTTRDATGWWGRVDNGFMGLFSQRPEEPAEWAGIPSEPLRSETAAERLAEAPSLDLGLPGAGAVESIVIPVAPVIEVAQSHESGDGARQAK